MILVEDAKRLWKNLRDTYVRKKREEKEMRSGQAGKAKKKWKYGCNVFPGHYHKF